MTTTQSTTRPTTRRVTAIASLSLMCLTSAASLGVGSQAQAQPAQAAGSSPAPTSAAQAQRPNIVTITVDDAVTSDLRFMPRTRRLIGDEGVTMTNALAPTPLCVPSRASLLTGRYAHNHRTLTNGGPHGGYASFRDAETLPVWLSRAGYDTAYVGKYMNGYQVSDTHRPPPGWQTWNACPDAYTYNFSITGLTTGRGGMTVQHTYSTDGFTQRANAWLASRAGSAKPFYLSLNYVAPHDGGPPNPGDPTDAGLNRAYMETTSPAPRHFNMFRDVPLPNTPAMFTHDPTVRKTMKRWNAASMAALKEVRRQRYAGLQAVDEGVARLIDTLRRTGKLDNTIVTFLSDNGYMLGEHSLFGKTWFYNESNEIPMLMRGPGIPQGRVVDTIVTNADLPVTLAAAAGVTPGAMVDGVDVRPLLDADVPTTRAIPIESYVMNGPKGRRTYWGMRLGNEWMYLRFSPHLNDGAPEILFDLKHDPDMLHNLAMRPKFKQVRNQLRALTRRHWNCQGAQCSAADSDPAVATLVAEH